MKKLLLLCTLITGISFTNQVTAQTYCDTNLYSTGCTVGDDLDDVTIGNFSQTSTGCSTNGYADYTTDTIVVEQLTPTGISVTSNYSTQWYAVWVDFNSDGDFDDAGEFLWSSTAASGPAGSATTGSFIIDTSAAVGTYRLRLRGKYSGTAITSSESCTSFTYGEVHDYTVNVLPPPACPAPFNLVASGVSGTSATVSWVGVGTQYYVEYGAPGFTPGSGLLDSTTTSSYSLTGLTVNSTYDVYVRSNCSSTGNGFSMWAGPVSITTTCGAVNTYPFVEDFDDSTSWTAITGTNYAADAIDNCWNRTPLYSSFAWIVRTGATPSSNTGPNGDNTTGSANYIYTEASTGSSGNDAYMVLPAFDLTSLTVPQFSFWYHRYGATMGDFEVQASLDTGATWTTLVTITGQTHTASADPFLEEIIDLSSYKSANTLIRFKQTRGTSYTGDMCIDDVRMEEAPPCPKVSGIAYSNITSSSVDISFLSSGTKFLIEYGPCGYAQGTGMVDTVTSTMTTLSGLAQNASYEVYILNDCSAAGNGLSAWKSGGCFSTECSAQVTPLLESFDVTPVGNTTTPSVPDCWAWNRTNNGSFGYGYTASLSGLSNSGSQFFYIYQSGVNDTMALISPSIAGMDTADKHITFWARGRFGSTAYDEHIIVATLSDPTDLTTINAIDTVSIKGITYQYFDVYLDSANGYNGTDNFIALIMNTGSSNFGYACIDDVGISDIPACIPSTGLSAGNVTNNSALISWVAGDGLAYDVEYGPTGFAQGTGSPMITGITSTSQLLSGLDPNSCYDVYVRDSCASGYSPWFGPITFCTACNPVNTPFVEDFESISGPGNTVDPSLPNCWSYWRTGTYYGYTSAGQTPNGSYHWRFYNFSNTDTVALISPLVGGITNGDKQIRFKNKSYYTSTSYSDGIAMEVGTSPTATDLRSATAIDTVYGDYGQGYVNEFTVFLDTASGYNGTDGYVYMRPLFESGKWYAYNFVDDIHIEDIPLCSPPWNIGANTITGNSANITWSTIYGTGFQIEYDVTGFIPGTGNGTIVSNATSGTTITGLAPNTYYDVYVADNCDSSVQAGPFTFKTACLSQLSGNYTVGGAGADFATLDSAISVLAGCGVSGPTTLTLQQSDTANSMVLGAIPGSSSTNTVTIKGSSAAGTDTIYASSLSGAGIDLGGTSYLTFMDVTVLGQTTGFLFWLHDNANHITFDNCNLIVPASTSTSTGGINVSSSPSSISGGGDNANDVVVTDCKIEGGGSGINIYGSNTTTRVSNFTIENNEMANGTYGVRAYYVDGLTIEGNSINTTGAYGLYIYYPWHMDVIGNQVYASSWAFYTYRPNYLDTSNAVSQIENNFLGGGTYGMYGGYWENLSVLHNSYGGGTYGSYVYGGLADCEFRNNIFVGSSNYAFYNSGSSTNTYGNTLDYNVYYTSGGSNIASWSGTAYSDLAAWQAADTTKNSNSLEGDPGYLSPTDFHIIGTLPNDAADNNTSVVVDIDGESRPASGSTTKDIGADEFTPLQWDASLESIDVALAGCGDSTMEVSVTVKNFGQNVITTLPVTVLVSGGVTAQLNATHTDSIPTGTSASIVVGAINTAAGVTGVMFDGYTALAGDQKSGNDTVSNVGPGAYISYEPQYYMPDTVCASLDSATFAAVTQGGVRHGWFTNAADTVPTAIGDSFTFSLNGQTTWYLGYMNNADSLTTTFAAGNGQNGNIFDINVKTSVSINGFTINAQGAGTAEVWYRTGSYVGYENSNAGWTNLTTTAVPVAGAGAQYVALPAPLILGTGIHALYVTMSTGSVNYTNGSSVGAVFASNADLDFYEGLGKSYPFGSTFSPRVWNGVIHYGSEGCSNVKKMVVQGLTTDSAMADFSHNVQVNGADVDFDGTASMGQVFEWTFGDGGAGTGAVITHTYAAAGTYTACLKVTDTVCGTVDSICKTVTATVGIEESLLNQTLSVYPNPTRGKFRVEFQVEGLRDIELRIVSLLGQTVQTSKPGRISGRYTEEFNLRDQAAGVYLLQVVTEKDVLTRQVAIRK